VYWLQRPPYLRWAAAGLLVLGAFVWEARGSPAVLHPFLARDVAAGTPIGEDDVEWREIPAGLAARPDLASAVAAVDLAAGEPLFTAALQGPVGIPDGWWGVPVQVGAAARAGDQVLLVVTDPMASVSGIVVTPQQGDPYSLDFRPASVAVPAESAPMVAAAAARGVLVAAVRPGG
jgi:hypothetical protein